MFSGHEHLFARMKPQQGVQYFISGAAGSLRKGDARRGLRSRAVSTTTSTSCWWKSTDDAMYVQAISRLGRTVDAAVVKKQGGTLTARDTAGPH